MEAVISDRILEKEREKKKRKTAILLSLIAHLFVLNVIVFLPHKNHMGDDGLQYTFNNEYPTAAMPLSNNKAIFITTETPNYSILGDINNDDIINVLDVVLLVNVNTVLP